MRSAQLLRWLVLVVLVLGPALGYHSQTAAVARRCGGLKTLPLSAVTGGGALSRSRFELASSAAGKQTDVVVVQPSASKPNEAGNPNRKPSLPQKLAALAFLLLKGVRSKANGLRGSLFRRPGAEDKKRAPNNPRNEILALMFLRLRAAASSPRSIPVLLFLLVAGRRYLKHFSQAPTLELPFSLFLQLLAEYPDKIKALRVTPSAFRFVLEGKHAMSRVVSADAFVLDRLLASGVEFSAPPVPKNIFGLVGTLLYALFLWKVTSRMLQGPQDAEGAGKSREKMNLAAYGDLSFRDVAGQDGAKLEVQEVCEMLKDPSRYANVGARLPAGVLLVGPPGSGKTLLARVTAAEARVPFYACSASDFVEVFVGRGPARVRKLFKQAADNAPSIVFIDEIDSIGRSRRSMSMNSEQETTLNQILTCMDGLDTSNNGVIVMAATNR
mmetsp:Transcript_26163/g.57918  ORF Transcript_26163/g.57918 Transcript_26163/m.57918 type:complete len:441 (+) Transcript_26163:172-1494(+)